MNGVEKLTYIEGHRIFVMYSNRTCEFTIKTFDALEAYEYQHIHSFYFSGGGSKFSF